MTIRTFRGKSVAEALAQVKKGLGSDAVILHTRTYRVGTVLGFGGKTITEITATSDLNVPARARAAGPQGARTNSGAATQESKPRGGSTQSSILDLLDQAARRPDVVDLRAQRASAAAANESSAEFPQAVKNEQAVERAVATAPAKSNRSGEDCQSLNAPMDREAIRALVHNDMASIHDEMQSIRKLVGQVLQASGKNRQPALPEALFECYLQMMRAEVAAEIADGIVGAVRDELSLAELKSGEVVRRAVLRHLAAHLPAGDDLAAPGRASDGRPLTVALIGPTGVGKTTTLAKLAAIYKLRHGKKVGLVTCDTYRIAAVDQLRTYAGIIGLPLKVALTTQEVASACDAMSDLDVILVDTAGRSQRDVGRLAELRSFLEAANPHQTHLVLSCASSEAVLKHTAAQFAELQPTHVIFSKLDEAVNYGVLVNVAEHISAKLSFVTMGQEVPDHIEPGSPDRLARLVLAGETE